MGERNIRQETRDFYFRVRKRKRERERGFVSEFLVIQLLNNMYVLKKNRERERGGERRGRVGEKRDRTGQKNSGNVN